MVQREREYHLLLELREAIRTSEITRELAFSQAVDARASTIRQIEFRHAPSMRAQGEQIHSELTIARGAARNRIEKRAAVEKSFTARVQLIENEHAARLETIAADYLARLEALRADRP